MTHILTDKEAKAQRGWTAFTGPHGHVPDWDGSPQMSGSESSPTHVKGEIGAEIQPLAHLLCHASWHGTDLSLEGRELSPSYEVVSHLPSQGPQIIHLSMS